MTQDHDHPKSLRAAQLRNDIPDGWYYDDYDVGAWLVVIDDRIVKGGIPSQEEAIRIFHERSGA